MTVSTPQDETSLAPSSPRECALIVALPLTKNDFLADVQAASEPDTTRARGDYAFGITRHGYQGDSEAAWCEIGVEVSKLCRDLIDEARGLGVAFLEEKGTFESLRQAATSGASTIILIAHWRDAFVSQYDLRTRVIQYLRSVPKSDAFEQLLAVHLEGQRTRYDDELGSKQIAQALNQFISSGEFADRETTRDELDSRFAGTFVPGSCLELRDGYHKAKMLATQVPNNWRGVFELGVCHSVRLAVALKDSCSNRLVITNEAQKQPSRCLREIRETLLRLSYEKMNYLVLRSKVFAEYSNLLTR
jgi:hypothetical protein